MAPRTGGVYGRFCYAPTVRPPGPGRALCAARARESGDRGGACGRAAWRLSPAALSVLTQHTFFAIVVSFENLIISVTQTMLGRSALSVSRVRCVSVASGLWGPVAGSSAASALSRPAGRAAARARERERERERESSSPPVRSLPLARSLSCLPLLPPSPASAPHMDMRIPSGLSLSAQKETTILSKNGTQKGNKNGSKSNSATQCNHRNQSKRGKHRPPHVSHRRLGDVLVVQTASLRPRLPSS